MTICRICKEHIEEPETLQTHYTMDHPQELDSIMVLLDKEYAEKEEYANAEVECRPLRNYIS